MALCSVLIAVSVLAGSGSAAPSSDGPLSGRVFEDRNGNGLYDKGEKGIGRVAVSDGFSVTLTDRDGRFSISPAPKARFITVYTPEGYCHTNRFYYDIRDIMADGGTGRTAGAFDFGLSRCRQFGMFIHTSDIESWEYRPWIDQIKEYSSGHDMDFIVVTGDLCYEKGLNFYSKAMNSANVGRRVVYTVGNHDLIIGFTDYLGNSYGEKLFEDNYGPAWYSFNVCGVHFVVTPMLAGDARPSYSEADIKNWIIQDLRYVPPQMPVVLFNHDAATGLIPENSNIKAIVYGHRHFDLCTERPDGLKLYCSGPAGMAGNDHSPSAFREFRFGREGLLSAHIRYTPMSNQVVAHKAGSTVHAVVYDAASDVSGAVLEFRNGRKVKMHKVNDLMWEAPCPENCTENGFRVIADFSDGERIIADGNTDSNLVWMTTLPCKTFFTDPVVSDGHVFIAGTDSDNASACCVFSLNAGDGHIEWQCPTVNSVKGDIVLNDGVIYAGDAQYNIYAISASDGTVIWQTKICDTLYPSFTEGVSLSDGKVFVGTGRSLCALDAASGKVVWNSSHLHDSITNVCTNATANGALLTNGYWVGRFCYDTVAGALLWEKKDLQNRFSTSSPSVEGDSFIYTGLRSIWQVDSRSGDVVACHEYPYKFGTRSKPLVAEGRIIVGTSDSGLLSVKRPTLEKEWLFSTGDALVYTSPYTKNKERTVECSPVQYGGNVIFGANDGIVYCLGMEDGEIKWTINIGLPVISDPVIVGGHLYISDLGGNIYCYEL